MRPIVKGSEPPSLATHRAKPNADYDNYAEKDDLRASLVREQAGLCCYCMQRIHPDEVRMKIEHWLCQKHHGAQDLDYENLLGACLAAKVDHDRFQHCDTRKQWTSLQPNPAVNPPPVDRDIRYLADGRSAAKTMHLITS